MKVLRAKWSKKRKDIIFDGLRSDMRLLYNHLDPLFNELERRGYDLTTFKLAVDLKPKDSCCSHEKRNMNGGCDNCGAPCL